MAKSILLASVSTISVAESNNTKLSPTEYLIFTFGNYVGNFE
jgi:hypothetical protein